MRYRGKNLGTNNLKERVDITESGNTTAIIIYDNTTGTTWTYDNEQGWSQTQGVYPGLAIYRAYGTYLAAAWRSGSWYSGDYTYTDPATGGSIRFYDITVNTDMPDSVFQH